MCICIIGLFASIAFSYYSTVENQIIQLQVTQILILKQ